MTWARLDDSMGDHPKIVGLSDRAFRAHILAILYSAKHLTDGHIPSAYVKQVTTQNALRQLVDSGVWTANGTGYVIHDYAEYQPSRDHVLGEREKVKRRVHKWRERNAVTNADTNAVTNALVTPPPLTSRSSTPTEVVDRGIDSPGRRTLQKRLQQILPDSIIDGLTASQAELVAAAWKENDVEIRHSLGAAEKATRPVAYLVKVAQGIVP